MSSLLTLGTILIATQPASAQRVAGDDPAIGTRGATTITPVAGRGYRLEATVATLYDSNMLRLGDGVPPIANNSKSDFRVSPAVSGSYAMPVGRQQLFIGGLIGRDFYLRNGHLNRNRYILGGGLNWRVARSCTGSITAEYQRRQSLFSELSEFVDNVQETRVYQASGDCTPPVGIGFGGSVRRTEVDNDTQARSVLDTRGTSYEGHLSFGSAALGRFSAGGNYSNIEYPQRLVLSPSGSEADGLKIYSGRLGYSRALGSRFTLGANASYIKARPQPKTILQLVDFFGIPLSFPVNRTGYSGIGYSVDLGYRPSPRISANFTAGRDVTSTANVSALYTIVDTYGVDVGYKIGPALTAGAGGTYIRRKYRGSFISTADFAPRISDTNKRVYGRLSYAAARVFDIDLEVAHQWRTSNPADFNFSSTSAALTLRARFGRS